MEKECPQLKRNEYTKSLSTNGKNAAAAIVTKPNNLGIVSDVELPY
jgi:hypothetical protein